MGTRGKLLLAALIAASTLATAIGSAGARRLALSENHIRAVWEGAEEATVRDAGGFFIIECDLTIEGSFHSRTLSKVSGQLIGFITVAEAPHICEPGGELGEIAILNGFEPDETGEPVEVNSLPWHIRYDSFKGTLPNVTGIRVQIIGAGVLAWNEVAGCLYRSTAARPAFAILEVVAGTITTMRWEEVFSIPLEPVGGMLFGIFCPASAKLARKSISFEVQRRTTRITVRLVQ
jgi:hypothetical protein